MKKILCFVVAFLVVAVGAQADISGSRVGSVYLNSATITNNSSNDVGHTHITTSPTALYRITWTSSQANTYIQCFDSAGTGSFASTAALISAGAKPRTNGNKFVKADPGGATANTSYTVSYNPPLQFNYGLLAGIAGLGSATGIDALQQGTTVTAVLEYRQD